MPVDLVAEPQAGGAVSRRRWLVRLTGLAASGLVVALAVLGLIGGLTGQRLLDSPALHFVPMAPSTATLFLLLGGLLLLRVLAGPLSALRRASGLLLLAVSAAVFLELIDWLFGSDVGFLDILFRHLDTWTGVPHVEMSPAAAALFALSCAASWSLTGRRDAAAVPGLRAAGNIGAAVALGGSVFFLGYVFGTPLLYASSVIPMARSTALAFLLLGAALICEAGPELQPLRMFSGPSTKASLLRAFVPLVVALSLAHSLVLELGGPFFGQGNALIVAGIAVGYAVSVGLAVTLVARRVGGSLERSEAQRSEAEGKIRSALGEKTVMLKEIHHRVKNNMHIVSSLLLLQSEYVADPRDRALFEASRARIQSMAMVHEGMYLSEDLSCVDMADYVPRLVGQMVHGSVPPVRLECAVGEVRLPITQSVPFGMLLNELVMNAMKHAFALAAAPELRVTLRAGTGTADGAADGDGNGHWVLVVEDNGPGLPPGFSLTGSATLGMNLVDSLTQQLHGQITAEDTGHGARFALRFPMDNSWRPASAPE